MEHAHVEADHRFIIGVVEELFVLVQGEDLIGAGIVPFADEGVDGIAGHEGGVADEVHVRGRDLRIAKIVEELLSQELMLGIAFLGDDPAIEPDVAAGGGNGIIDGPVLLDFGGVDGVDGVTAPGEVHADHAFDHVLLAGVDFESEDVLLKLQEDVFDLFDGILVAAVEDGGDDGVVLFDGFVPFAFEEVIVFVEASGLLELLADLVAEGVHDAHGIGIAHGILDRHLAGEGLIPKRIPVVHGDFDLLDGHILALDDLLGVIKDAQGAPHIADGIIADVFGFAI